jgi:hypothetical protein
MKKIICTSVVVAICGFMSTTNAQIHQGMMSDSTQWQGMHHGMHQDMMHRNTMEEDMHHKNYNSMDNRLMMMHNSALAQCFMLLNRLPKMQEELSLTDDQVFKLIDLQADYKKQKAGLMGDLQKGQLKLKSLVKSNAGTKDISDVLKSCATTMANIGTAAYDTATKMKGILNDSQKQKLNELMERFSHDDSPMREMMDD